MKKTNIVTSLKQIRYSEYSVLARWKCGCGYREPECGQIICWTSR